MLEKDDDLIKASSKCFQLPCDTENQTYFLFLLPRLGPHPSSFATGQPTYEVHMWWNLSNKRKRKN